MEWYVFVIAAGLALYLLLMIKSMILSDYDPDAPTSTDDGLSFVDVDNVELPNIDLDVVSHIDSVSYYDSFCIDIYEQALALINEGMYYKLTFRCIFTHN